MCELCGEAWVTCVGDMHVTYEVTYERRQWCRMSELYVGDIGSTYMVTYAHRVR